MFSVSEVSFFMGNYESIYLNLYSGLVLLNGPGFVNKVFTAVFNQLFDGEEGWKEFHELTTYGGTVTEKLIILNG